MQKKSLEKKTKTKMKQILTIIIIASFSNCGKNINMKKFTSEYNFSINIPKNWSEYETEEKNTNAFFDTTQWTGNLRITPMNYEIKNEKEFLREILTEENGKNIDWKNIHGIYYVENTKNEEINYWYLIEKNKLYICSFTVGNLNGKTEKEMELNKVTEILKTIKTE
jgi:Domain of unknown function (DUF3805)